MQAQRAPELPSPRAPEPRAKFSTSTSLSKCCDNSLRVLQFFINISGETKVDDLALEYLSSIFNPTLSSINLDLASLLAFIKITYDCIQDDSYTQPGCSGHLRNQGYCKQRLSSKYLLTRCTQSYLEHRDKDSTNLLLKSLGNFIHSQSSFPSAEV